MINDDSYALIMAGGSGIRFWPYSTDAKPKQFLTLYKNKSMLRLTVDRISKLIPTDKIYIVTSDNYFWLTHSEIPDIPISNIITEPNKKDTAAAIMLGCSTIYDKNPDSSIIVLPADHVIETRKEFLKTITTALNLTETGKVITIGITPTYPSTDYGYLELGTMHQGNSMTPYNDVKRFVEKPDKETASVYMESKIHYWNSGIFVWRSDVIMDKIKKHLPQLYENLYPLAKNYGKENWRLELNEAYKRIPSVSIDYGVLEKDEDVIMIPAEFKWNDVGNWQALKEIKDKDEEGNYSIGNYFSRYTADNIIVSESKLPLVAIGVKNLIIASTDYGVLVCNQDNINELKDIVKHYNLSSFIGRDASLDKSDLDLVNESMNTQKQQTIYKKTWIRKLINKIKGLFAKK